MRSLLKRWEQLPQELQNDSVRPYYEALSRKRGQLLLKRVFDILLSLVLLVLLSPVMLILALAIRLDSPGEVLFRQVRVTQYGQEFRIFKFRTMVANAQQLGTQVTVQGDMRITRVGKLLRKCRLDELPQLLNILMGQMSFVGTRPEARAMSGSIRRRCLPLCYCRRVSPHRRPFAIRTRQPPAGQLRRPGQDLCRTGAAGQDGVQPEQSAGLFALAGLQDDGADGGSGAALGAL